MCTSADVHLTSRGGTCRTWLLLSISMSHSWRPPSHSFFWNVSLGCMLWGSQLCSRTSLVRTAAAFCKLHRRISPKIIWPLPQAQHVMPKSCKGVSGWVLIGVVSRNKHACKETSYLQFVKGLVGVRVLQLLELEKLKRSPRHFQLPSPPASVYLRIVIFRWRHIVVACNVCCPTGSKVKQTRCDTRMRQERVNARLESFLPRWRFLIPWLLL